MKTFDEAVELVIGPSTSLEEFARRYACLQDDIKSNSLIAVYARENAVDLTDCCALHHTLDVIACCKAFFHMGVAVGIEMEKAE